MFSLVNKHEEFFDFLVTNGEYFHKGTLMVKEVLQDPKKLERCAKEAEKIEHLADGVTHEVAAKMKHVFITPIDREDFYLLTSNLDDCVDDIKDVIFTLRIYHAGLGWNRMLRMADILIEMSGELIILFRLLKDIDKMKRRLQNGPVRSIVSKVKQTRFIVRLFLICLTVPMMR